MAPLRAPGGGLHTRRREAQPRIPGHGGQATNARVAAIMAASWLKEQIYTAPADRPTLGRRGHMITLALGAWIMLGLFLDFMAHNARTQDPFFSTAHLVMFSGIVAVTVWMLRGVIGPAGSGRRGLGAVPAGYESGLLAIVLFAVTLIADPLWHAVRGVEQGILALTSPSHAPTFVGVVLLLSCPFRAAWVRDPDLNSHAPSLKAFLPTLSSISLTMLFVGLTFTHVWPFFLDQEIVDGRVHEVFRDTLAAGGYPAAVLQEVVRRRFLSGIYLANLMLFAPLLLMLLRWRLPPGAATICTSSASISWWASPCRSKGGPVPSSGRGSAVLPSAPLWSRHGHRRRQENEKRDK